MRRRFESAMPFFVSAVLTLGVRGLGIPHNTARVAAIVAPLEKPSTSHRLSLASQGGVVRRRETAQHPPPVHAQSKSVHSQMQNASVWVFFTTTEKRAHQLPRVVESLMRQTHTPHSITINIGDAGTMRTVRSALQHMLQQKAGSVDLRLMSVPENGPGTKYPTQEQLDSIHDDNFVLIVDDDWDYSPKLIERFLHGMTDKYAHSFHVRTEGSAPGYSKKCPDTKLEFPLGYASRGIMFRKTWLDGLDSFRKELLSSEPMCKFVDDMYVSGYLFLRGIGLAQVHFAGSDQPSVDIGGGKDGALRQTHERGCENNACRDAVLKLNGLHKDHEDTH